MKKHIRWICVLLLVLGSCGAPQVDSEQGGVEADGDFFQLLRRIAVEYEVYDSLEELLKGADVAVIGVIESIDTGRALGAGRDQPEAVETFLITVRVQELVSGDLPSDSQELLDLELYKPSLVSLQDVRRAKPETPLLLVLTDTANLPQPSPVDDSDVDREPGKSLFTIPSDTAIFVERANEVLTPLSPSVDAVDRSVKATSLQELAAQIRSL
ncbi:MAG: hypothetical protein ACRDK3_04610 [Actinomycetota bacterium]